MSARSILGLLYTLKAMEFDGIDIEPVLKRHGLDLDTLDASAIIERSQELRILMDAYHHCQDELLGLHVGKQFGLAGYGPLSLLLMTSANAFEACQTGVDFQEVAYLYGRLSMALDSKDGQGLLNLCIEPEPLPQQIVRFIIDRDASGMHKMISDMAQSLGQKIHVRELWLPYGEPSNTRPYQQVFNCPIKWGQSEIRLVIQPTDLHAQLPQANKMAQDLYRNQCMQQLKRQQQYGGELHQRAKQYLELFSYQYPNIQQVSQYLHVSERTLRRRLKEQETSYQQILDDVRFDKAKQLLQESQESIDGISQKLGFSEAAAFNHAFMRWSGLSPGKWRKQ